MVNRPRYTERKAQIKTSENILFEKLYILDNKERKHIPYYKDILFKKEEERQKIKEENEERKETKEKLENKKYRKQN